MNKMKVFKFIKADPFFKEYAPEIKNYKRKISGNNGRGNPLDFTDEERKRIVKGLKQMIKDLTTSKGS